MPTPARLHPTCDFVVASGACPPTQATLRSAAYDLSIPRVWHPPDVSAVELWHNVDVQYEHVKRYYMHDPAIPTETPAPTDIITSVRLYRFGRISVDTGVSAKMWGCSLRVYDRSSTRKRGLTQLNPAVIDEDYTGTIVLWLYNLSPLPITIVPAQAVAQIVVVDNPRTLVTGQTVRCETRTSGNAGGFGSTDTQSVVHNPSCLCLLTPDLCPVHQ